MSLLTNDKQAVPKSAVVTKMGYIYEEAGINQLIGNEGRCTVSGANLQEDSMTIVLAGPSFISTETGQGSRSFRALLSLFRAEFLRIAEANAGIKAEIERVTAEIVDIRTKSEAALWVITDLR